MCREIVHWSLMPMTVAEVQPDLPWSPAVEMGTMILHGAGEVKTARGDSDYIILYCTYFPQFPLDSFMA